MYLLKQEFATLDVEDIMAKQLEQLEKEKKELQERLKNQERKVKLCITFAIQHRLLLPILENVKGIEQLN